MLVLNVDIGSGRREGEGGVEGGGRKRWREGEVEGNKRHREERARGRKRIKWFLAHVLQVELQHLKS